MKQKKQTKMDMALMLPNSEKQKTGAMLRKNEDLQIWNNQMQKIIEEKRDKENKPIFSFLQNTFIDPDDEEKPDVLHHT